MSATGERFCTICGCSLWAPWGTFMEHHCGGTPTYCGTCGKPAHFPNPCRPAYHESRDSALAGDATRGGDTA